jgi:hypothetical protein
MWLQLAAAVFQLVYGPAEPIEVRISPMHHNTESTRR